MARIYNGFNALGLGQAINNTNDMVNARRVNGLQALGGAIEDFMRERDEQAKEQRRRQSAIDYLTGTGGMDEAKASQMVDTITPEQAVLYLTGRLDKQADKADEREYQELDYLNKRADMLADKRKDKIDDWNDWVSKNNITYGQAAKQAQFGQLMQQLGLISAKDWGNSRQGVDQYNDTINALKQFAEKNNEYMDVLGLINPSFGNAGNNGFYDEDIKAMLRKLGGKDTTDQQREDYLKELIRNDKFSYILDNPNFSDAKSEFIANVNNKKLMPFVNLQKLIGTNTTQTQRNKQINEAQHAAYIKSLKEQMQLARRGKAPWPKIQNKKDVDEIRQDKIFAQIMKGHY